MTDNSHDNEFCRTCGDELVEDEYAYCAEHAEDEPARRELA